MADIKIGSLTIDKLYLGELQVDKLYLGETLVYGGGEPEPVDIKALKFEAKAPGQVLKTASRATLVNINLEYSYDGTTWTNWEDGYEIPFPSNNVIYLRGMNNKLSVSTYNPTTFSNGNYNVSGNIMHLLDYTQDLTTITGEYAFASLFKNCTLVTFDGLKLPATTIAGHSYQEMFYGCESIIIAPSVVGVGTYSCSNMFRNCSNLEEVELLAETLDSYCYQRMFSSCSKLKKVTIRATDISANSCLSNWMSSVPAGGTFKCIQGVEYPTGNSGVPNGWTVEYV